LADHANNPRETPEFRAILTESGQCQIVRSEDKRQESFKDTVIQTPKTTGGSSSAPSKNGSTGSNKSKQVELKQDRSSIFRAAISIWLIPNCLGNAELIHP
jgi:hypothetical protein